MLQIGRKQAGETLVGLLLGCHERIRSFLAMAALIDSAAPDVDVADAAARVRRYFSQALPLHVEDEEESILPRLQGRSPEVDAALDRMHSEHLEHVAPLRSFLDRLREPLCARKELASSAKALLAAFEPHLEAEERVVFPAINALLTFDEQQAIVRELRARRQLT